MRRQLNILYVTTDGAWLRKDGENLVMEVEGTERARLPVHMLEGLVCFGRVMASPALLGFCAERGIVVSFLTPQGRFLARVEGPVRGNVLLRKQQYRISDRAELSARIAANMLAGKWFNQRAVLQRGLRDHGQKLEAADEMALVTASERLRRLIDKVQTPASLDELRGLEGEAALAYFDVFDQLLRVEAPELRFERRSRRPPLNAVNALLSFLYTLVTHDCRSALETVGLDPAVGFLHRDRPGRPSLALDLLEEFRAFYADRLALSLINRRQIAVCDFDTSDGGAVTLKEDSRKKVLVAYQERKREELKHPFLDEKMSIGLLPFAQAQLLARHLRGDLDAYPPFLWK